MELKKDFYVVSVITNPERYKTRIRLFQEFMVRMKKYDVNFYVVEGALGDRDFEVTDPTNPCHIQIRVESEIWLKENLINLGISRLPPNWKYVAWIDGDIDFVHPLWIDETIHELQHHPVVQLFEDSIDLGPTHEILATYKSFGYCYKNKLPPKAKNNEKVDDAFVKDIDGSKVNSTLKEDTNNNYYYDHNRKSPTTYWHPGYAWAATRDAINTMGGLLDFAIIGAADHHMACSLIGDAQRSIPKGLHPVYVKSVLSWQSRAMRLHKNIGYVKGTIYHYWHGKKRDRKYKDRWQILIDNQFNPITDIHKNWQGIYELHTSNENMRDQIRGYFQARNEDSIDKV